jgi:exodeoxyribonuclease V gamma subunit
MPLKIYTSNRMETLVEQLCGVVRQRLPSPFIPETIVVQSKGMQRWLAMELARQFGVWANCDYPFPNEMIERLFRAVIPDLPAAKPTSSFQPDMLTWRLMGLLPDCLGKPGFEPLAGYLAEDGDGLKRLQLAAKIADTFDQYTVFRPDMLVSWEKGADSGWQALLWRELVRDATEPHRASLLAEFRRRIARPDLDPARLPRRISLIGIPTLPPFHLEVLAGVARQSEVNLFLLNPCREYWGKIVSARELARLEQRGWDENVLHGYFETGNPLLASLGGSGRDFFDSLLNDCGDAEYSESFTEVPQDSLLHTIQADILTLRDRADSGGKAMIAPADDSLRIHSCHSPMREVEVLYDQLLALFDRDPTLAPRDVLVMTPDIEAYAPYVSAVFGTPERAEQRIPYTIADRSLRREGEVADVFLAILHLCGSRFGIAAVLDILETPAVYRRFNVTGGDLETIRQWLTATNVRWGIDAAERGEHGLPAFGENSWQAGLDRLMLGYAMTGDDRRFFHEILPYDQLEGGDALVLGHLLEFCATLFSRVRALDRPRSLKEWAEELHALLTGLIAADGDEERDVTALREVIDRLDECREQTAFVDAVGIEVVRAWLEEKITGEQRGFGFLTGGVTFCAMLPMRSIPARVIALLGMNDGVFPRQNRPRGFDLIAAAPRRGDRSQRDEDRYLFLEALLSARERFFISYVGQSIRDNSELPPSVLVSELLDYIDRGFGVSGETAGKPAATVCVRQRLQPFSRAYFQPGNEQLFSYNRDNLQGVLAALASPRDAEPFLATPLASPRETSVTVADLAEFFTNPCKYLLRRQLGVYLEQRDKTLEESEPFALDHLAKYRLGEEIVAALVTGESLDLHRTVARSRGELPPGECGTVTYAGLAASAEEFAAQVAAVTGGAPLPPLEIDLAIAGSRLVGRLSRIWSGGLIHYRYAKLKAKDRLRIWIEQLAINCAAADGYPRNAVLLGSDAAVSLAPVAESRQLLEGLLALYQRGLTAPLSFFPETALEYAKKANDPKKAGRALADARKKWHGSEDHKGEKGDPYYQRCFGDLEPLDDEFTALARTVYTPLILAQQDEKKLKPTGKDRS